MTRLAAQWLDGADAQAVSGALESAGHEALFVGGCVRNTLLGTPVTDLDLATDARPERVMEVAEAAGLKAVPTGLAHGTVTLVHRHHPVEVTTYRADVETHGRHATVRFSGDVAEDARRRDFTMNALYCDRRGRLVDPLGGLPDLRARRLRFVGDPGTRVREDYLRILRFFRFHAWYADPDGGLDPDGLAACAAEAEGLARISAERIGAETKKLLAAPEPAAAVAAMATTGVLPRILPGADAGTLARLIALEPQAGVAPDAILRLAALGGEGTARRLRLSRAETRQRDRFLETASGPAGAGELAWRHGAETARKALLLRAASGLQPVRSDFAAEIARGASAAFPVTAKDLAPDYAGAALGMRLKALERAWIDSGFVLSREDLLALPAEVDRHGSGD